jgi:glycosyltransferase involved in cell wall biosynthesis
MRILFFYQYYHNFDCAATGRHYGLIRRLAQEHEVHVITSDTWVYRRQTDLFPWAPEGVSIHSVHAPYGNAMGIRARVGAYTSYAWGAWKLGLRLPRPDLVIGTSTPLSAAWVAARVAGLRGVPWIFEVRDLWPDFPIQMGAIQSRWLQRRLFALERRLYTSARHVVPLSVDMEAAILSRGIPTEKVTTLVNGTDMDLAGRVTPEAVEALRSRHGIGPRRVVLYAGTFGRANAVPEMVGAAEHLRHRSDLCFVFLGEGYHRPILEEAARRLPNVIVAPPEPRHAIFAWFGLADLSLVPFVDRPVLAANSPAKFFDSLAMGTPVVVTNPGWTRRFVNDHGCGWAIDRAEPVAMAGCIEEAFRDAERRALAGRRGREAAVVHFDRAFLAERFATLVASCVPAAAVPA